jgi:hypothetical protein
VAENTISACFVAELIYLWTKIDESPEDNISSTRQIPVVGEELLK